MPDSATKPKSVLEQMKHVISVCESLSVEPRSVSVFLVGTDVSLTEIDFRRIFAGTEVQRERAGSDSIYSATRDGVRFLWWQCAEDFVPEREVVWLDPLWVYRGPAKV